MKLFCVFALTQPLTGWAEKNTLGSILKSEVQKFSKMDSKQFKEFAKSRKEILFDFFKPTYDPYSGMNSVPEVCQIKNLGPEKFLNKKKETYHYISVYASNHFQIGNCSNVDQLTKLQYLMLHCKESQQVYIVKTFYNNKSSWADKPAQNCSTIKSQSIK